MTTELVKPRDQALADYQDHIVTMASSYMAAVYGSEQGQEAAGRVALAFVTAARRDDQILQCSPESVAEAVAFCAFTGLSPSGTAHPEVYLYRRGGRLKCDIAPHGWYTLFENAGYRVVPRVVYQGDAFDVDEDGAGRLVFSYKPSIDAETGWDNIRGAFVRVYDRVSGEYIGGRWMRKSEIAERRANSDNYRKSGDKSVWGKWPAEMAEKTILKYAASRRVVPMSGAMGAAIAVERPVLDVTPDVPQIEVVQEPSAKGMQGLRDALPVAQIVEAPDPIAPDPVAPVEHGAPSPSDLKTACHELEQRLTGEPNLKTRLNLPAIINVREECGIRQRADIRSTRYSAESMVAYRDALEAQGPVGGEE